MGDVADDEQPGPLLAPLAQPAGQRVQVAGSRPRLLHRLDKRSADGADRAAGHAVDLAAETRRCQRQRRLSLHSLQPSGDGLKRLLHLAQCRAAVRRAWCGLLALAMDQLDPAPQRYHFVPQRLERPHGVTVVLQLMPRITMHHLPRLGPCPSPRACCSPTWRISRSLIAGADTTRSSRDPISTPNSAPRVRSTAKAVRRVLDLMAGVFPEKTPELGRYNVIGALLQRFGVRRLYLLARELTELSKWPRHGNLLMRPRPTAGTDRRRPAGLPESRARWPIVRTLGDEAFHASVDKYPTPFRAGSSARCRSEGC